MQTLFFTRSERKKWKERKKIIKNFTYTTKTHKGSRGRDRGGVAKCDKSAVVQHNTPVVAIRAQHHGAARMTGPDYTRGCEGSEEELGGSARTLADCCCVGCRLFWKLISSVLLESAACQAA